MARNKVSPTLRRRLGRAAVGDRLDIVLSLATVRPRVRPPTGTRAERVAALKRAFDEEAGAVEKAITALGGRVTARAWSNSTLRAELPADAVPDLAELEEVEVLDVPVSIGIESGSNRSFEVH